MSNKDKEYLLILGIIFSLAYVFWPISESEKLMYEEVSMDEEPIQIWRDTDKKWNGEIGNVIKIKYKVEQKNTNLWISDIKTGKIVHKQPFSMNPYPEEQNKPVRNFTYVWKLYKSERTEFIPAGDYEICVGTRLNSNQNYYLEITL